MGDSYFDREAITHVENLPEAVANADGDYDPLEMQVKIDAMEEHLTGYLESMED